VGAVVKTVAPETIVIHGVTRDAAATWAPANSAAFITADVCGMALT